MRDEAKQRPAEALAGYRWLVVAFRRYGVLNPTDDSLREAHFNFATNGRLHIFDGGRSLNGRHRSNQAALEMRVDSMTANAVVWPAGPNLAREQHEAIKALCPPEGPSVFTTIGLAWSGLTVTMSAHGVDVVIRRAGHLPLP